MPRVASQSKRVRISAEESPLVRLGVVYANSLRLTIVTELFMREMSTKQFFDEVGGPSLDSVRKQFAKLEEYGWLRRVRQRITGRGRPEWIYRAVELAIIDEATWAEIPPSIRDACTLQLMQQLSERIAIALKANTFVTREDQVFTLLSPLTVDEAGWKAGLRLLNDCVVALEQEQCDAKVRLAEHCRSPTLMIVALAGFESPRPHSPPSRRALPKPTLPPDVQTPWMTRLAKVFGDPINLEIVRELNGAQRSPSALWARIGRTSKQTYDRRCKVLTELGWIRPVGEETGGSRRGAREVFYSATTPAVSRNRLWDIISPSLRVGKDWDTYRRLCDLVFEAVRTGTFNVRVDRHLTWQTLLLDDMGHRRVADTLESCVDALSALELPANQRTSFKDSVFESTFFVGGFESPQLKNLPLWGDY